MTSPSIRWADLPVGRFRALEWDGAEPAVLFLHGLTGIAEVWGPTISRLTSEGRPRCLAIDQRGHGQSPRPDQGYAVRQFVDDVLGVTEALDLGRPHLVGHSMGARVAMVAAARHPERFRSVAIVDIGPEAWRANWEETIAGFDRMPADYPSLDEALARAPRSRGGESIDAALASDAELRWIASARFKISGDGRASWWADRNALRQIVRTHRSTNYWHDWRSIKPPALFIRGGTSSEVRPAVAERMRKENAKIRYLELDGVGHNIPLLAPGRLAEALTTFWATA